MTTWHFLMPPKKLINLTRPQRDGDFTENSLERGKVSQHATNGTLFLPKFPAFIPLKTSPFSRPSKQNLRSSQISHFLCYVIKLCLGSSNSTLPRKSLKITFKAILPLTSLCSINTLEQAVRHEQEERMEDSRPPALHSVSSQSPSRNHPVSARPIPFAVQHELIRKLRVTGILPILEHMHLRKTLLLTALMPS